MNGKISVMVGVAASLLLAAPGDAARHAARPANTHVVATDAPGWILTKLRPGMTLSDVNGQAIGTIVRIVQTPSGTVRDVLVTPLPSSGLNAQAASIPASTITVTGGVASTSLSLSSLARPR